MNQNPAIKFICTWSSYIILLCLALVLIMPTLIWFEFPTAMEWAEKGRAISFLNGAEFTFPKQVLGLLITMLPVFALTYTLLKLRQVFGEYAKGRIFSQTAVTSLRLVGLGGCMIFISKLFVTPLMSLAMTYDFPKGERMLSLSIGLSSEGLLGFFATLMFLVLAWVMGEAKKNAEDLASII